MRIIPITLKVNLLILVSLTIGIGSVTVFLGWSLSRTIEESTRRSLDQEADIVYQAIEQLMMPGEAPLVVDYFRGIGAIDPRLQIHLYRTDATAAFSDNATITDVNNRLGAAMFAPRPADETAAMAPPVDALDAFMETTGMPPRTVVFEESDGANTAIRYLRPVINLPKCTICHGSDHTVRGVLDIRSDITESIDRQREAILTSSGAFLVLLAVVGLIMSRFIRAQFIAPLREIGATCEAVTVGDFERRSGVQSRDELGQLSRTVNSMVEGLYERFVLSRYVSGSTIAALGEERTSRSETLTFLFSDIRGFTSFTEQNEPEIVVTTLNALLGDQTEIIAQHGGDIDKYVGDEIVAVFSGADAAIRACRAALEIQAAIAAAPSDRYLDLQVGIGINGGIAVVGEIGSQTRADFTAVGDTVNIAARLCSAAARGEILVSSQTADAIDAEETPTGARLVGPYRMAAKGKAEALRVFKLTATEENA